MNESLLDSAKDQFEEDKDWQAELVGPDKKYKDQAALAKAVAHGQFHISSIERENAEMRAELARVLDASKQQATIKDVLDQIRASQTMTSTTQGVSQQRAFDPEEAQTFIKKSVLETIQENRANETKASNFNQVKNKLQEVYGSRYQDTLKKQLDEMGTSVEEFDDLAKNRPAIAIKALGLDRASNQESFNAPPSTRERFAPTGQPKRTWTWYENLRKTSPDKYFDLNMQRQMEEDYRRLGKDFEDGEFRRFAPAYQL